MEIKNLCMRQNLAGNFREGKWNIDAAHPMPSLLPGLAPSPFDFELRGGVRKRGLHAGGFLVADLLR